MTGKKEKSNEKNRKDFIFVRTRQTSPEQHHLASTDKRLC